MQIVIDIPDNYFNLNIENGSIASQIILKAVKNGTPLPKGHGKLVDVNSIPEEDKNITVKSILAPHSIACIGAITLDDYMNNLPTVIEADKE